MIDTLLEKKRFDTEPRSDDEDAEYHEKASDEDDRSKPLS